MMERPIVIPPAWQHVKRVVFEGRGEGHSEYTFTVSPVTEQTLFLLCLLEAGSMDNFELREDDTELRIVEEWNPDW